MNKYILDLDELFENDGIYKTLENISDGIDASKCEIEAESSFGAAVIICERLTGYININLH